MAQEVFADLPNVVGIENLLEFDFSDQGVTLTKETVVGKETVIVKTPRGSMSWRSAISSGLIKVPGRKG